MAYDEKTIIRLLAESGSQRKAFEEIVRHYSQPLYWKIRNIVLSHDDADDVLQNTFVKAWMNLSEFKNLSKLSTWLYRIAINESLDFLRRKKHAQDLSVDEVASVANTLMADEFFDGDQAKALLYEAIDTLPDVQRMVFNLRYFDNMKYNEISQVLGTSEGALMESAMLYPILIGIAVICAICFMVVFILPTFVVLFENFQTELPLPTRILLALGRFAEVHGMWIPVITALAFAGFAWILRQETLRYFIDYWILRIPFIGSWRQDTEWMHILSTLAVELESGMRIDVALRMVREVPSNRYLRQFLGELEESVSHGYPLVHLLGACPVFPPMLLELIAAGENTGRLEEMLRKAADYCELSSENFSQRLQAMAEPSMLLLLGGVVLGFVLSIVLPLMEMMDQAM